MKCSQAISGENGMLMAWRWLAKMKMQISRGVNNIIVANNKQLVAAAKISAARGVAAVM